MSIGSIITKDLWRMLDFCMVELNKPIKNHDQKLRDGTIDHEKMDREKLAGEALGIARSLVVVTGRTLNEVRAEAIERYETRKR